MRFSSLPNYGITKEQAKVSSCFRGGTRKCWRQPVAEHVRSGDDWRVITLISEEIKRRVTKKLSHEFNRTELLILGVLFKFDEFFLNPQVRTCSGTVPGLSRNNDFQNGERTGDHSQSDPYPKVELFVRQASNSAVSNQEETSHNILWANILLLICDRNGFQMLWQYIIIRMYLF